MDPAQNNQLGHQSQSGAESPVTQKVEKLPKADGLQNLSAEERDETVKAATKRVLDKHHEVLKRLADQ